MSRLRRFSPWARQALRIELLEDRANPSTFTVTNFNDSGAGSLRDAITSANSSAGFDQVVFQQGLTGTIVLATGPIDISDSVSITGPGAGSIVVSGNNASQIFTIGNTSFAPNVVIAGLTLSGGSATAAGGAVLDTGGALTVSGDTFTGNQSATDGGAIALDAAGALTVQNTTFTNNSAVGVGGAVSLAGGADVNMKGATFTGNSANAGGALAVSKAGPAGESIQNSTFSGNTARAGANSNGGAIFLDSAPATLTGVTITGNSAGNQGGGVAENGSTLSLTASTVEANGSGLLGGGIAVTSGSLVVDSSTIDGNTANDRSGVQGGGGGVFLDASSGRFVNSTVAGNKALGPTNPVGGGIAARASALTLLSTTVSGNSSTGHGGGVYLLGSNGTDSSLTLQGTIVATNTTTSGTTATNADLDAADAKQSFSASQSLVQNPGGVAFAVNVGNLFNQDPRLGPLQNNGGPTKTQALQAGSPAIDKGINSAGVAFDQRGAGFPRQVGSASDIGAVEFTPPAPPAPPPIGIPEPNFIAVGSAKGSATVMVFDGTGGLRYLLTPFPPGYRGGVRVAVGDVNGDGVPDIICGGASGFGQVSVFSGADGHLLSSFNATGVKPAGGVFVAAGDVLHLGRQQVIVSVGGKAAPIVEIWDGLTGRRLASFLAYDKHFLGGVSVAAGDVNGDGFADIITAPAFGAGPVIVRDGRTLLPIEAFFPYAPNFPAGVRVAAADLNGTGHADIIVGTAPGGAPLVRVFDGATGQSLRDFAAFGPESNGVDVATASVTGDGRPAIVVSSVFGLTHVLNWPDLLPVLELPVLGLGLSIG